MPSRWSFISGSLLSWRSAWLPFVRGGSAPPSVGCRVAQGLPRGGVNVVPHGGFGSKGVFVFDHFQDRTVFTGGGFKPAGMFNRAQDQPLVGELVHEPLVVLHEFAVIRAADDGPV